MFSEVGDEDVDTSLLVLSILMNHAAASKCEAQARASCLSRSFHVSNWALLCIHWVYHEIALPMVYATDGRNNVNTL